jgi:hypothetical protein
MRSCPQAIGRPAPHNGTGDTTMPTGAQAQRKRDGPWLQQYTQWTFEQLHSQIYPIVEKILEDKMFREHPFRIKWRQLQGTGNKYPMMKNSSWRNIKLLLEIEDISQYREFIATCPTIEHHIHLKAKSKTQVEFGNLHTEDGNESLITEQEQIPNEVTLKEPEETMNTQDLLSVFVAAILEYMERNTDEYADLCEEWLTDGLDKESNMEDIKRICNITPHEDLYMLLKLSLALQHGYELTKTANTIQLTPQRKLQVTQPNERELEDVELNFTTVLMEADWSSLHKQAFTMMTDWANTQRKNHLAMAWRSAVQDGLTQETKWSEAKQLLLSNTFVEYACYLTACPLLESVMKIHVDTKDYLVNYALYDDPHPLNTISVDNTPIAKNTIATIQTTPNDAGTHLSLPTLKNGIGLDHMGQQITTRSNDTPSKQSWEQVSTKDHQTIWEPEHPVDNFAFVNSMIFKTINEWAADQINTKHPFYGTFQHVKYKGYSYETPWSKICDILHIEHLGQYIDFVYPCPAVHSEYQLYWNKQENTIRYRWRQPKDLHDLRRETHVIQSTYMYMKSLAYDFDMKIQKMKNMMSATNTELVRYQNTLDNQIKQGNGKITQHAARTIKDIIQAMQEQTQKHTLDIEKKFTEYMMMYQDKIDSMIEHGLNTLQERYQSLNMDLKWKIDEVSAIAISEIKAFLKNDKPADTVQSNVPPKPNPHFPNVILPPDRERRNPFADQFPLQNNPMMNGTIMDHQVSILIMTNRCHYHN